MEWISVEDRLPRYNQLVLIYHDQEYLIGWVQIIYSDGSARFKESGGMYNIPATHWAELTPPKQ